MAGRYRGTVFLAGMAILVGACTTPTDPSGRNGPLRAITIHGSVTTSDGTPVVGATVTLTGARSSQVSVLSDVAGRYSFGSVPVTMGSTLALEVHIAGKLAASRTVIANEDDLSVWVAVPLAPEDLPNLSATNLELVSFTIGPANQNAGAFFYYPSIEVRDTAGVGTSKITSIAFYVEATSDRTILSGPGCLTSPNVGPGQHWDMSSVYLYCRDYDSQAPLTHLNVAVGYVDAQGRPGLLTGHAEQ
jgi:hypothetical protein